MKRKSILSIPLSIIMILAILLVAGCTSAGPASSPSATSTPSQTIASTPAPSPTTPAPNATVAPPSEPTAQPTPEPASVTVSPVEATNPVKSQHTFTAVVKEADGSPSVGAEVQWILNRFPEAVGDIVEVTNHTKLDNTFAISKADADGKARMTITSTREGDTDVTVYVPGITDPAKHKVFALKHWVDMMVDWPVNAVNKIGTEHEFSVKVYKATTGAALPGVNVIWTITDDAPDLKFKGQAATLNTYTTVTNAAGTAAITVQQAAAAPGKNTIRMDVMSAAGTVLYTGEVTKEWLSPSLNIVKTGTQSAGLNTGVDYTITVRNDGAGTATAVKVVDTVPAGLTYVSSSPSGTLSGSTLTWNIASLAPGASSTITVKLTAAQVGTWTNMVNVTSAEGVSAEASATTEVTGQAGLQITKSGPATLAVGQNGEYVITVKNTGNIPAAGTIVKDTLPSGMTYVSSTPAGTASAGTVTWNLGSLAAGATSTIKVAFKAATGGTWTNTASASATGVAAVEASSTTKVITPSVSITKSAPPSIYLDKTGQFTMTVTNTGETALTNVKVTDTLPSNLSYVSATPAATVSGKTVTWTFATLASGATQTVTLQAKATGVGSFTNSVTVTTTEGVTDTATDTGMVNAEAGVTVQLIDTVDPVPVGSQTTYEVTITNQGAIAVHDLKIVFQFPDQVSFVSAGGATGYSLDGNNVTFQDIATLAAGATVKVTITVMANTPGDVVCTVIRSYREFATPTTLQEGTTIYAP